MTPESLNTIAVAATAAGYVSGQIAEQIAIRRAAEKRQPANETWQLAAEAMATDEITETRTEILRRGARRVVAPLALAGASVCLVNTLAWAPASTAIEQTPATLEIVVDHSGATNIAIEGEPVVMQINKVVAEFDDSKLTTNVTVARSGTQKTVPISEVSQDLPFGDANMQEATSLALSRTAKVMPVSEGDKLKRNAGVLVITNGNTIGDPLTVVTEAVSQYGGELKTPVFIVNVEGDKAGPQITEDLQMIAKASDAKYWDAEKSNLQTVVSDVRETITAREVSTKAKENRLPLRGAGILVFATAAAYFASRGLTPFGKGIKGKRK